MFLTFAFLFSAFCLFGQEGNVERVELQSATRGYKKTVEITPDSVLIRETSYMSSGSPKEVRRATRSAEWEQLMKALEGVTPAELPELQAPTKNRASDAALHSTLTISTPSATYQTPAFDNYRAHPSLQQLMEAIRKVEEEVGKAD